MADILQMMIEFLRINCQTVNCYYPNPFEGLFYLILLPMVVLIAFVYIIFSVGLKIEQLLKIGTHLCDAVKKWGKIG